MKCRVVSLSLLLALVAALAPAGAQRAAHSLDPNDPLAKALQTTDVYIGKTLRDRLDAEAFRPLIRAAPSDAPLKIVVVGELPQSGAQFGTRDLYTKALHEYLGLGPGTLVVVTRRGVSVATSSPYLHSSDVQAQTRQYARAIQRNPVEGVSSLVNSLNHLRAERAQRANSQTAAPSESQAALPSERMEKEPERENGGFPVIPMLIVGAGVGGLIWWGVRAAHRGRAMEEARRPVERLRAEIITNLSYADNYLDLLPASEDATAAKQARQEAAAKLEQASQFANQARTPEDYERAQAILEQAREAADRARHHIDLATGGTGLAMGIEGTEARATPKTTEGQLGSFVAPILSDLHAEDIPENERSACFFCSRPARISDLTPVTLVEQGRRRKVLACADDLRIIRQGATPEVRTVIEDGREVPWYASRRYDPYRDYDRTPPTFSRGYARSRSAPVSQDDSGSGMLDGFLLGWLLSHPAPMPYPVFVMPSGEVTANPQIGAAPTWEKGGPPAWYQGEGGPTDSGAGADFGGADFDDASDADQTGGFDWGRSSGSVDFGGIDFGDSNGGDAGGFDWGSDSGSDFGSSDFGGGDSGGSDY